MTNDLQGIAFKIAQLDAQLKRIEAGLAAYFEDVGSQAALDALRPPVVDEPEVE